MITTSYFAMAKYLKSPVSISNIKPKWYTGPEIRMLVPPFHLVNSYKAGYLSDAMFTKDYTEGVLNFLSPADVYAYIMDKFGEDATLICYEAPDKFCHRRVVARWLEKGLGIKVPELVIDGDLKKLYKEAKAGKDALKAAAVN
jgi:hypothetical protein